MKTKYEIEITHKDGTYSYLTHKDRTAWSELYAKRLKREIEEGKTGVSNWSKLSVLPVMVYDFKKL